MKHEITDAGLLVFGTSMAVFGYLWGRMHALAPKRAPKPRRAVHTRQHHR